MNFSDLVRFMLSNFALTMFALSILFILIHLMMRLKHISFAEIIFRWTALFALGFTGVYTFVAHVFFADASAEIIGWAASPFQFEVGVADLALGLLGIFSFQGSIGFRSATVLAAVVMLWGDAAGHIYQMITAHNFAPGNAGSWFYLALLIPLILLLSFRKLKVDRQR